MSTLAPFTWAGWMSETIAFTTAEAGSSANATCHPSGDNTCYPSAETFSRAESGLPDRHRSPWPSIGLTIKCEGKPVGDHRVVPGQGRQEALSDEASPILAHWRHAESMRGAVARGAVAALKLTIAVAEPTPPGPPGRQFQSQGCLPSRRD